MYVAEARPDGIIFAKHNLNLKSNRDLAAYRNGMQPRDYCTDTTNSSRYVTCDCPKG